MTKLFKVKGQPTSGEPYTLFSPVHETASGKRVIFIIDRPTQEDMAASTCPSGPTLDLLKNIIEYSEFKGSWLAMPFAQWSTATASDIETWVQHVGHVARAWKADAIICFDHRVFTNLVHPNIIRDGYLDLFSAGTLFKSKVGTKVGYTFPLKDMLNDDDAKGNGPTNLLSVMVRHIKGILTSAYNIRVPKYKTVYIDTLKKFDQFYEKLCSHGNNPVAIDTETDGLGVRTVKMLTAQFCMNDQVAWFLPYLHKDSPWSSKQLNHIRKKLANWFETDDSSWHVYCNSTFDLNVLKANIGYQHYKSRIWDISMGEHCLDENIVFVNSMYRYMLGNTKSVYSLANIAASYSCFPYLTGFRKDQRSQIGALDLTDDVIDYGVKDVIVPWLICQRQLQRADDTGYGSYRKLMLEVESDKHHAFAIMRWNGVPCDLPYVQYLANSDCSPIYQAINDKKKQILSGKAVQECNKRLASNKGYTKDIFGSVPQQFALNKEAHRQMLFFDVLKLAPLRETARGGALDKEFKKTYATVPEVAALNDIEAYGKLLNTYVDKVVELYGTDRDLQYDRCVRPRISPFLVTGRISESDPNMQQIPKKGRGLYIKRIYTAPQGYLCIKADYKAHEVRGWGIISKDAALAQVFQQGIDLIEDYRTSPSEEKAQQVYLRACPHRQNVHNVHGIDLAKADPKKVETLRDEIKALTFGPLYGKGAPSMAKALNKDEQYVKTVLNKMFGKFASGNKWLTDIEKQAMQNGYVEAPTGRRRTLLGALLLPKSSQNYRLIIGAIKRKARNSPIQGMCSDVNLRSVRSSDNELAASHRDVKIANVVHDSQETFVKYSDFWYAVSLIERSMVQKAGQLWKKDCGHLNVRFEIDMEIGSDYANMNKWDWSYNSIITAICNSLVLQKLEIGYNFDPIAAYKEIMSSFSEAPKWLQKQKGTRLDGIKLLKQLLKDYKPTAYASVRC